MKKKTLIIRTFENFIAVVFSLRAISFVWLAFASNDYMPLYATIVNVLTYITILLGPLYLSTQKIYYKDIPFLYPVFFYYLMLLLNTYGGYKGSYIHEVISISCFLLMKEEMKVKVFTFFYKIVICCCSISVLLYIFLGFGIPVGFEIVPFYNDGVKENVYVKWFIFGIIGDGTYGLPRLCSIFNEPGGLGTLCGLLYAVTYSFSNKFEKIVLIITTLLTLSMAGYILIILFYCLKYLRRRIKYVFPIILLVSLIISAPSIDWGNDSVNKFVKRFEFSEKGFKGDDRVSHSFSILYDEFLNSDSVLWGMGATYGKDQGASSYKNLIIQFGFLGFGLFFIIWVICALKAARGNKECLICLLIFVLSIYQRPVTITNSYGYVLLFGGFATYFFKKNKQMIINNN